MKKIPAIVLFVLLCLKSTAQDNFNFSQYFQIHTTINPAGTGIDNFLDVKLSYRNQWTGLVDAPTTQYFGVNGYLQKETQKSYTQYALRTSNPYYLDSLPNLKISLREKLRHGIGGNVVSIHRRI